MRFRIASAKTSSGAPWPVRANAAGGAIAQNVDVESSGRFGWDSLPHTECSEDKPQGAEVEPRKRRPEILAPVDFSPESLDAARFAMRVARRGSGRLIIFHAVHLNLTPYGPANPGWLRAALCREALEKMEELMAEARRMEIPAVSVIEEGAPAEAILRATLRWQVELMVMTSPRGGRLSRLFAGGIHDKLARLAKCPVVVVRPEAAEKAEP